MSTDIKERMRALGLDACASTLDDILAHATKKRWGIVETLEHIASIEEKDRARRGLDRRMQRSRLDKFKPMTDFDWNWPTKIDRPLVESLLSPDFVDAKRNVVLVAQAGLGKTMIAQNIANAAVLGGHSVLFLSAADLLLDLAKQESASQLERRLRHYSKVGLLVLDELGFLAFDNRNADLLFQVISRRYEKKSLVLTTNLAFKEWHTIFPTAICATALVERVVHHADIVTIEGESYRLRESQNDAKERKAKRKTTLSATRSCEPAQPGRWSVQRSGCSAFRAFTRSATLLDEPGLSLHGKAQEDLLRYFETEVITNPKHQLIYSTHSPFMVESRRFDRVRIVQDKSIDAEGPLPRAENGTKVFTDVLEAGPDTLFPLQGALGYEIYQTLFVGPNSLVVEGVSDLLYIQTVSALLQASGRVGLDPKWTITPVGGSDKVPTFVALLGAQTALKVAVLVDFQKADQQVIENLYRRKLLKKSNVLTFADFTGTSEADIEDMFDQDTYLQFVNGEFARELNAKLKAKDLTSKAPRILVRLEEAFRKAPLKSGAFSHFRPARYFAEKSATLILPDTTLARFEAAFKAVNALS